MQTREHFTLSDQIFFHIIIIHDYVAIRLSEYILVQLLHGSQQFQKHFESGGVYFNIFPNFLAISESRRCNKKPAH